MARVEHENDGRIFSNARHDDLAIITNLNLPHQSTYQLITEPGEHFSSM